MVSSQTEHASCVHSTVLRTSSHNRIINITILIEFLVALEKVLLMLGLTCEFETYGKPQICGRRVSEQRAAFGQTIHCTFLNTKVEQRSSLQDMRSAGLQNVRWPFYEACRWSFWKTQRQNNYRKMSAPQEEHTKWYKVA